MRLLRILLELAILLALSPGLALANADDPFAALLDQRMPELLAWYGVPGSVVASIKDGGVVWSRAYGVANAATGAPMQADMMVEHGSNGKAMTAWAVMKLVEQGRVDLDAPVNQYLKRWQVVSAQYDPSQVTLRRLLSHTSGLNIHGYLDYSPRRNTMPDLVQVLDGVHPLEGVVETLETGRLSLGRAELVAQPGAGYKYSGAGYTVAQMVDRGCDGRAVRGFRAAGDHRSARRGERALGMDAGVDCGSGGAARQRGPGAGISPARQPCHRQRGGQCG